MKRIVLIAIVSILSMSTYAQENQSQEQQTLFGNKRGFGAFIGFTSQAAEINGQPAYLAGGEFKLLTMMEIFTIFNLDMVE